MRIEIISSKSPFLKKSLLSVCIALNIAGAYAQTDTTVEEILVLGQIQKNLENALDAKRTAPTIQDGISAEDIGTLPALDMGEALQAVAGVQLNREGERRESSVNLRGLPAGFVLTTVNGQQMASPTRVNNLTASAFGPASPLGAFDPAVFSGITVVKTSTAEMIEGGISGTINQQVGGALSKPDGRYVIQVGGRFEELADTVDSEFVFRGSKHIIEDQLAINATLATSDQTFRRDTIKINQYNNLTSTNFRGASGETFDQWLNANGLDASDAVQFPGELRQGSEISEGSRTSFSGGIEWQATDEFKFGYSLLITERKMDENTQQEIDLRTRLGGVAGNGTITPLASPVSTGKDSTAGGGVYSISDIAFRNVQYGATSRIYDLTEEADAHIFDFEWENDVIKIDSIVTISKSESMQNEIFFSPTVRTQGGVNGNNGISGVLHTGQGNVKNYYVEIDGTDNLDFDLTWVNVPNLSTGADVGTQGANLVRSTLTGSYRKLEIENNSFELNGKYKLDLEFWESIQIGARISNETSDFVNLRNSPSGIDFNALDAGGNRIISNSIRHNPEYYQNGSNSYFGGEAPGFAGPDNGWFAVDLDKLIPQLTATIDIDSVGPLNGETAFFVPNTGLIQRAGQQTAFPAVDTELDTIAFYAMTDFYFDWYNIPTSFNVGARWVSSESTSNALLYQFNKPVSESTPVKNKDDYSYLLPSTNLNFDLSDDVKLRFAYNKSIVRPNLASDAVSPLTTIRETDGATGSIDIRLTGSEVEPFEADSYDISLEWYNRKGSSISVALFQKEIEGFFTAVSFCDEQTLRDYGIGPDIVGSLSFSNGECSTIVNGEAKPVNITQTQNSSESSTLRGAELSIQQNLSFLPYPWDGFGGVVNYTHTEQDQDKLSATNRIYGISEGTTNLIAFYEQGPFGIRFAYNYRTDYALESTNVVSTGTGFNGVGNKSVKSAGRLDMSMYLTLIDDLTLSLKGYNLTNTLYEEYQDTKYQPRAQHYDGQTWVISARYNF